MYKSKPIIILRAFNPQEIKEFEKFIQSPYFNKNKTLTLLFQLLKKEYPEFTGAGVERERLFFKLYQSREFDESKLQYAFSDLSKLLEKYIMLKELEKKQHTAKPLVA